MPSPLAWLTAPCVMGILNVTPDSFSDGGEHLDPASAVGHARRMAADGAAIVDVGGESTRPGAAHVPVDQEMARVVPVLKALAADGAAVPVSIDTRHAAVAAVALDFGAVLVNDVSAGGDPGMFPLVADRGAGLCLMHMQGEPATMQDDPRYDDVVDEVAAFLEARMRAAVDAGVSEEAILLDPGIGFGKTVQHNLALLDSLPRIVALGRPVLVGVSRKGIIGALTGREVGDRLAGSIGAGLAAVQAGAAVLRVHDVVETVDAMRAFTRTRGGGE
ncbi:MAG: dihydropteroate synthase [Thermoleophilia bacterium]|nr:dihydropteroate synthase [Thermoleophilia bacterium]